MLLREYSVLDINTLIKNKKKQDVYLLYKCIFIANFNILNTFTKVVYRDDETC